VRLRPLYRPDDHSFNEHMREAPMSPFCCSQAEHLYVCKRTSEEADQVKKLLRSSIFDRLRSHCWLHGGSSTWLCGELKKRVPCDGTQSLLGSRYP
jgi:hypothetical protein